MKRLLAHPFAALAAGLAFRLFFVFRFPSDSGDTVLYEEIATNWLKHGAYAMTIDDQLMLTDLRMPGYPGFLAAIYALSGHTGAAARLWALLAQVAVDLLTCLAIATLAALLLRMADAQAQTQRVFTAALWLAVLCPFTANYTAVPLTEVCATFFTVLTLLGLVLLVYRVRGGDFLIEQKKWALTKKDWHLCVFAGISTGCATLFRPESPLLLFAAWMVLGVVLLLQREARRWIRTVAYMGLACALPLLPWAARNALTLHELQFLTPRYSQLPGEIVPRGLIAWEKTWLYRFRDVYLVSWKLNAEPIRIADISHAAFDTPDEKTRVAAALAAYNRTLLFTVEEDAVFAAIARERTARRPLRTFARIPLARVATLWFTPRIELLPYSGEVFPLREAWEDDPMDLSVTAGLFLLNLLYVALALWGAVRLWLWNSAVRPAVALLAGYILLRTAFLTTLETPEPRYVVVCFPILITLAAHLFARPSEARATGALPPAPDESSPGRSAGSVP